MHNKTGEVGAERAPIVIERAQLDMASARLFRSANDLFANPLLEPSGLKRIEGDGGGDQGLSTGGEDNGDCDPTLSFHMPVIEATYREK
jgi:hypothetical protein